MTTLDGIARFDALILPLTTTTAGQFFMSDDTNTPKTAIRMVAEQVLPDSATARMSRIFDVNQRSVQKWFNGSNDAPQHVIDFLNDHSARLFHHVHAGHEGEKTAPSLDEELAAIVSKYKRAGVHDEVLGAHLALIYKRTVHREVE